MTGTADPKFRTRIRAATAADGAAIVDLTNRAFAIETFLHGTRTDEETMAALWRKGEFLVAEDPAGTITASVYIELRRDRGYFGMLAVDPRRQGNGQGRALADAAEKHCRERGCRFMDITVLSLGRELLPFYHQLGYLQTGTAAFQPSRPLKDKVACHTIVLSKNLRG
jgi:ribosomal protein S18 acetylase RimI-like enzyme